MTRRTTGPPRQVLPKWEYFSTIVRLKEIGAGNLHVANSCNNGLKD